MYQRPAFGARRFPARKHTADPYANPSTLFSHVLTLPTVARAPNPPLETRLAALPPPPQLPRWSGSQPHSNSVPPSPTHGSFPTDEPATLAPGSSSTIHKTVLKRPAIATLHVDGTRVTNGADVARQFAAELRVLRTVAAAGAHPNIVGFVGAIDGLGIVLEWIDGATLFERITLGRAAEDRLALSAMLEGSTPGGAVSTFRTARAVVSEQERLVWCDEILSALCFVHSLGLTHGDVNTLNVLIVPSRALHGRAFGRAKLIDFGRSTAVGKHEYPAPCARPFCAPEVTRAWDRAMRGAAIVHERRSRSKSRTRPTHSGETTPRAGVASRFPRSNSHTPSCTTPITPCTPTASSGSLPLGIDTDRDPPSLSSSLSSISSLSAEGQDRESSPDSPTSPAESASTNSNSKSIPIPLLRRVRPKLPKRKTLPPPPPEPTIPDGQLADAYSFGVLVLCVALGRVVEFEQPDGYSHPTPRHLPYFNPPFDTSGSPAPLHHLPSELFLPQTDPSHPDAARVKTVASRVKKWMARWDTRRALDDSWAFGAVEGPPWQAVPDLDEDMEEDEEEEDEDADMTARDDHKADDSPDSDVDLSLGLGLEGMDEPEVGDEGYDSDDVEIHMVWG
ncbi:Tyrosine kinase [Ceratobasidium theobromae]|uniref:Tyrosine kinase n=1 Tax=Ceratobasidium theobromae TaxID=1582974 RepID=A0A5N5QCJ2_9AGAM|nr:Tyrosine kinase [Ceratobasidium theobromae]